MRRLLRDRRRRHDRRGQRRPASPTRIGYISTAGGAFLEFLEGATLPGVAALDDARPDAHPARRRQLEDARHASPRRATWPARSATGSSARAASRWRSARRSPRCPRWPRSSRARRSCSAAQNCHWEAPGRLHRRDLAADAGRARLPLRHRRPLRAAARTSARRTSEINRKVGAALQHGLTPILCVGETAERAPAGPDVHRGRRAAARRPGRPRRRRSAGACSPTSRSGRSAPASPPRRARPRRCTATCAGCSSELGSKERRRKPIRILYGGSVKPDNADALLAEPDIDGALVGGASLTGPGFIAIVRKAARGAASRGE